MPASARPSRSRWPAPRRSTAAAPAGVSSTNTGAGAPVTATVTAPSASSRRPPRTHSIAAADSALPTSRLASRYEPTSAAPATPTPAENHPGRPRSCTVAYGPGRTTRRAVTSARPDEPDQGAGGEQRGPVSVEIPHRRVSGPDELPAAGGAARVDGAVAVGQSDRSCRDRGARDFPPRHGQVVVLAFKVTEPGGEADEPAPPDPVGMPRDHLLGTRAEE